MLAHLTARGFRNLAALDWQLGEGRHLLLGGNGAGKTSLLEAIYVLATTRSFRAAQLAACCRHGESAFHLEGEVRDDRRWRLAVAWDDASGLRRAVDGSPGALVDHLAVLPVVSWTAADGELLTGPPAARRRLMDRGVVASRPSHLELLGRHRQALRQKRELLARGARDLEPWNEVLAGTAAAVIRLRQEYVRRLGAALDEVLACCGFGFPAIAVHYRPSPREGPEGPEAILRSLARARGEERRRRLPLVGPHRDELELRWAGRGVRQVASAGERKALGLALLAAHGRVLEAAGRNPVYLLDDADSELSPTTVARAWRAFAEVRQLVVTSNRPAVWDGLAVTGRWWVEAGRIRPSEDLHRRSVKHT